MWHPDFSKVKSHNYVKSETFTSGSRDAESKPTSSCQAKLSGGSWPTMNSAYDKTQLDKLSCELIIVDPSWSSIGVGFVFWIIPPDFFHVILIIVDPLIIHWSIRFLNHPSWCTHVFFSCYVHDECSWHLVTHDDHPYAWGGGRPVESPVFGRDKIWCLHLWCQDWNMLKHWTDIEPILK